MSLNSQPAALPDQNLDISRIASQSTPPWTRWKSGHWPLGPSVPPCRSPIRTWTHPQFDVLCAVSKRQEPLWTTVDPTDQRLDDCRWNPGHFRLKAGRKRVKAGQFAQDRCYKSLIYKDKSTTAASLNLFNIFKLSS